jgi:hypothetical protein
VERLRTDINVGSEPVMSMEIGKSALSWWCWPLVASHFPLLLADR